MVNPCHEILPSRRRLPNLFAVAESGLLTTGRAITAGAIFGLSQTNIRVTSSSLTLMESAGQGAYRPGMVARALGYEVTGWRETVDAVVPLLGTWSTCILMRGASRDRPGARASARALEIGGLQELTPNLFAKPRNLRGGSAGLRTRRCGSASTKTSSSRQGTVVRFGRIPMPRDDPEAFASGGKGPETRMAPLCRSGALERRSRKEGSPCSI